MKELQLIHTADWHLFANTSWGESGFLYHVRSLALSTNQIFQASRSADFLLIAGDIIERDGIPGEYEVLCKKYLEWMETEFAAIGRDRVIVSYGSHDKEGFGRKFLDSKAAPRTRLAENIYFVENHESDVVFYCVDSPVDRSKNQEVSVDMVRTISLMMEEMTKRQMDLYVKLGVTPPAALQ